MRERYEKKDIYWFINSLCVDYWHFLRYYFVSPEDCPLCQDGRDNTDGEKK